MRAMRERMKPILWIAIIGFLGTIVFAWGMGSASGVGCQEAPVVLVVNGEEVPWHEYYQLAEGLFRMKVARERSRMGSFYDSSVEPLFRELTSQEAIRLLIEDYAVRQQAEEWGLMVTEYEISQTIEAAPYFREENGAFSRRLYSDFLREQGTTDEEYRSQLGRQLLVEKIHSIIFDAVYVPEPMVRAEFVEQNQFASADFVVISYGDFIGEIELTEGEVQEFYEDHPEEFMAPAQASVDYISIPFDDLYAKVELSEESLRAYYEQVKDDEAAAGRIHARHILFMIPPEADEARIAAAESKAVGVIERLSTGEDFDALFAEFAREAPADPTAEPPKVISEDLGFFSPGEMVPEFEKAAYALKVGEFTPEPVRTDFGWHVIQRESDIPAYEEVRDELENQLRMDQAMRAADQFYQTLSQALSEGKSLEEAASLIPDTQILKAGPFAEDAIIMDERIGHFDLFRDIAFDLKPGQVSGIIHRSHQDPTDPDAIFKRDLYVLRVTGRVPARPYPLEEIRGRVEAEVLNLKAGEKADNFAHEILERSEEVGLDRAAEEAGFAVISADQITRDGNIPGVGVAPKAARIAFELSPGELSGVVRDREKFYLVRGGSVTEPSSRAYGQQLEELRQNMILASKNSFYRAWVEPLAAQAEVDNRLDEILEEFARRREEAEQAAREREG
ncbi:peptidyl-prolyl cis-trans isomerase [bacterium]|nr:peptidyl-prolyl cis-trans isomerase [bacterium]